MSIQDLKIRAAEQRAANNQSRTPCSDEHDQICRYVKQPQILTKVYRLVYDIPESEVVHLGTARTEVPMYSGKYMKGFADLIFEADSPSGPSFASAVCCEIKSGKVIVGEVLRQLKGYQCCLTHEFNPIDALVLVAAHLEPEQVEHLRSEGVTPIVLGTKYLEWKAPKGAPAFEI